MAMLARSGSRELLNFGLVPSLAEIEPLLRSVWCFEPEADETLRTIAEQVRNFETRGFLVGDCDDAAIVAAAAALVAGASPVRFVAIRWKAEPEFSHVFTEARGLGWNENWIRMDPTAPPDAYYAGAERMEVYV
jgi:hypothetical protein